MQRDTLLFGPAFLQVCSAHQLSLPVTRHARLGGVVFVARSGIEALELDSPHSWILDAMVWSSHPSERCSEWIFPSRFNFNPFIPY